MPRWHRCLRVICPIFPLLSLREGKLSITLYILVYSSRASFLKELEIIVQQKLCLYLKHCLSASLARAILGSSLRACGFLLQSIETWRKQESRCCSVLARRCRQAGGTQQPLSLLLPWSLLKISLLVPGGLKLRPSPWQYLPKLWLICQMGICQPTSRLKSKENEKATKLQQWLVIIWTCTERGYKHSIRLLVWACL